MAQPLDISRAIHVAVDHHRAGRLPEAEAICRQVLAAAPNHPGATQLLARLAYDLGKIDVALQLIDRAIQLNPQSASARNIRGAILASLARFRDAAIDFQEAIRLNPKYVEAYNNLGNVLREMSQLDPAIAAYQQALALQPDYATSQSNLAISYKDQGRVPEAVAAFDRALALVPDDIVSEHNRLYSLLFLTNITSEQLFNEHRNWNLRRCQPLKQFIRPHSNDRSPGRPLRIGYVSSDLRYHSVAFFLLPLLESIDRQQFHTTCYPTCAQSDAITARFRAVADRWQPLLGIPDAEAAQQIVHDKIDILVDLAGRTSGNRLLLFARKPAPVQVSWLGYPHTPGMDTIDWRLTDETADPPGSETFSVEKLFRLPHTAWCFTSLAGAPPIEEPRRSHTVFGSFNDMAKVNPPLLALWAAILRAVPDSRLILKNRATSSAWVRNNIHSHFRQLGISSDRIEFMLPNASGQDHLSAYNHLDIALDTFPYHGTTTTCEALWMGVPVITLAGRAHVSRVSVSLLKTVGLPDLVARNESEYIHLATDLAANPRRRGLLRSTLRQMLQASPLMDAPAFARDVQAAYRKMWHNCVFSTPPTV